MFGIVTTIEIRNVPEEAMLRNPWHGNVLGREADRMFRFAQPEDYDLLHAFLKERSADFVPSLDSRRGGKAASCLHLGAVRIAPCWE